MDGCFANGQRGADWAANRAFLLPADNRHGRLPTLCERTGAVDEVAMGNYRGERRCRHLLDCDSPYQDAEPVFPGDPLVRLEEGPAHLLVPTVTGRPPLN